jgi:Domain of unknown function (DUF4082)/Cadherin-like domain
MLNHIPSRLTLAAGEEMLSLQAISDIYGSSGDMFVTVTSMPAEGLVLNRDAPIRPGDRISVVDLYALTFVPRNDRRHVARLCLPENSRPVSISVDPDALASSDAFATITELPTNGMIVMSDRQTRVTLGQVLSVAQLTGLMFDPAPGACGQISLLKYRLCEGETAVEQFVLLVVGPYAALPAPKLASPSVPNAVLEPLTVALLIGAAVSQGSEKAFAASSVSSGAIAPETGTPRNVQVDMAAIQSVDPAKPDVVGTPAKTQAAGVPTLPATDQNDPAKSDDTTGSVANSAPRHRIGSSTPPLSASSSLISEDTSATNPPRLGGLPLASEGARQGGENPSNAPSVPFVALTSTFAFTSVGASPSAAGESAAAGPPAAPSRGQPLQQPPTTPTTTSPVAKNDRGFVVGSGGLSISSSALLANDLGSGGLPLSITGVGNADHGTVVYDAATQAVTFVPTIGYTGMASFTYTVQDENGGSSSATVSLFAASDENLFSTNSAPSMVTVDDSNSVELGVKFTASVDGVISGLRFYKGPGNTGPHVASLWDSNGNLLASATFSNETASGWQQVTFSAPITIVAGATYVASYHTDGNYSADPNYFANSLVSGDLTATGSVYGYGSSSIFPTNTYNATNYWVDVVYSQTLQSPVVKDDGGFVVGENGSITIAASILLANDQSPNGLALSLASVGHAVNGTVTYNSNTQSIIFTPANGYTGNASFSYSVVDANGGTGTANATLLVADPSPVSLFGANYTPQVTTANDQSPVELGFKFQADTNGEIVGIQFYKSADNTGTHVANLWSSTGTLLATATFSNETASGWQQVNFASPVAITAGATYVASYHTDGNYSADPNYFATAHTNGLLTAPSSAAGGGNGLFAYGNSSLFPTNTFNATGYGVDVLFKAQLTG